MKDILLKKILVIGLLLWSTATKALTVRHDLISFIGPFNSAITYFSYRIGKADYGVYSHIRTDGVFDSLYPFEGQYSTNGKIIRNRLLTETYHYKTKFPFYTRTKQITYDAEGLPQQIISIKNERRKIRDVFDEDNLSGTTDLQTVAAILARQYMAKQNCNARMPVYDGKHRFDIVFNDLKNDFLPQSEHSPYFGTARKCSMYIDKLDEEGDDMLWQITEERPIYFWVMHDKQTQAPFLARIKVEDTPLGDLNVYTTKIEVEK